MLGGNETGANMGNLIKSPKIIISANNQQKNISPAVGQVVLKDIGGSGSGISANDGKQLTPFASIKIEDANQVSFCNRDMDPASDNIKKEEEK